MTAIMTVRGPIEPAGLGATACHEHVFADSTSDRTDPDTRLSEFDTALEELAAFKQAGGEALVEVTTIDMGRKASLLAELSEASGVTIVAATGFYKGNYSPDGENPAGTWEYLPASLRYASVETIAEFMIREIEQGIDGTPVRPGIIGEIGTSFRRFQKDELKVFRAAGIANRETGIPISTHTTLGTMGKEQADVLVAAGADPGHILLSHMDLSPDGADHADLARKGVFLGFDTAGKEKYQSDERRIEMIQRLVAQGFEDQIVVSCDIGRRSQMVRYGGRGYRYLFEKYVPMMERAGIEPAVIHKFLVENPQRLLAF
jgi:predicted metal-dependent phosphotriesterase family hydrolase